MLQNYVTSLCLVLLLRATNALLVVHAVGNTSLDANIFGSHELHMQPWCYRQISLRPDEGQFELKLEYYVQHLTMVNIRR